ncbi:MAG TPA: hypothetical protein VGE31_02965 [Candidatus Paceibacterota bacterium]
MDTAFVLNFLSETAYLLIVFGVLLMYAIGRGRQAIINLIFGLYLALLITLEFPYYDHMLGGLSTPQMVSAGKLGFFAVITVILTWLCSRIMPDEFRERKFESLPKKIIHAASATILIMIFSFQVLPVTDFLVPGTPVQSLFAPEAYFFWWLMLPLAILFIL